MASYEKLREDNIKRNKQFLEEIGLVTLQSRAGSPGAAARVKRDRGEKLTDPRGAACASRRSSRIALLACPDYQEVAPERKLVPPAEIVDDLSPAQEAAMASLKRKQEAVEEPALPSVKRKVSCRDLCADIDFFLQDGVLGQPMRSFGKAPVMAAANGGHEPTFSKFPGVTEWKNALFLWVNIATMGSEYDNEFLEGGKAITWFGGSKMWAEHPTVRRLLCSIGSQVCDESSVVERDVVMLFVRVLPRGNYISLGRVSCRSADLTTYPIRMTWELEDFNRLTLSREDADYSSACETFKDVLAATNKQNSNSS